MPALLTGATPQYTSVITLIFQNAATTIQTALPAVPGALLDTAMHPIGVSIFQGALKQKATAPTLCATQLVSRVWKWKSAQRPILAIP